MNTLREIYPSHENDVLNVRAATRRLSTFALRLLIHNSEAAVADNSNDYISLHLPYHIPRLSEQGYEWRFGVDKSIDRRDPNDYPLALTIDLLKWPHLPEDKDEDPEMPQRYQLYEDETEFDVQLDGDMQLPHVPELDRAAELDLVGFYLEVAARKEKLFVLESYGYLQKWPLHITPDTLRGTPEVMQRMLTPLSSTSSSS